MAQTKINETRLREIRKRQWEDKWGKDYIPSIFANPKEAPSLSEFSTLICAKLGRRQAHTISKPETWLAIFALFNPGLWELHEQKILWPTPRAHFLHGHPRAKGQKFAPLRGTLDVAERMGILDSHPVCKIRVGQGSASRLVFAPFFYIGDLLLFLEDDRGLYCVNWNIKDQEAGFDLSRPGTRKPQTPGDVGVRNRNALERLYYMDGEIPTREIAGSQLDFQLRCNLKELFGAHLHNTNIPSEIQTEITNSFSDAIGTRIRADQLCRELATSYRLEIEDLRDFLKQGIWNRKIRIDLFNSFLMDKPLRPEIEDPLEVYADWFSRI